MGGSRVGERTKTVEGFGAEPLDFMKGTIIKVLLAFILISFHLYCTGFNIYSIYTAFTKVVARMQCGTAIMIIM